MYVSSTRALYPCIQRVALCLLHFKINLYKSNYILWVCVTDDFVLFGHNGQIGLVIPYIIRKKGFDLIQPLWKWLHGLHYTITKKIPFFNVKKAKVRFVTRYYLDRIDSDRNCSVGINLFKLNFARSKFEKDFLTSTEIAIIFIFLNDGFFLKF